MLGGVHADGSFADRGRALASELASLWSFSLRELRMENPQVAWEDVEAEWEKQFPRVLTPVEELHQQFTALLPHPELHGGKKAKTIWAQMETEELGFMDMVDRHDLVYEEGNLFSYLARVISFEGGRGIVDEGILPLVHFLDGGSIDRGVAMTLESNGREDLYPVVYVRQGGKVQETRLPDDPFLNFETSEHRKGLADALEPLLSPSLSQPRS